MQNTSQNEQCSQEQWRRENQYLPFVQTQPMPVQHQQMSSATKQELVSIQQNSQPPIQHQQRNISCIPTSMQKVKPQLNAQDQMVASHAQPVQSSHNNTIRYGKPIAQSSYLVYQSLYVTNLTNIPNSLTLAQQS